MQVFVDNGDSGEVEDDDPFGLGSVTLIPDRFNSTRVDFIRIQLTRIYDQLNQIERYQEWQKAHEARHRNLVEHNFTKVNSMSAMLAVICVLSGLAQVWVIRSFFEDKSAIYRLLKGHR